MSKINRPFELSIPVSYGITETFLENHGWILKEGKPAYSRWYHESDRDVECCFQMTGEFSIYQKHWCTGNPEFMFYGNKNFYTHQDYFDIVRLLGLKLKY